MIAILQTSEKKHLGFILFSSTDSCCIFQILPTELDVTETQEYLKLFEYHDKKERPYEENDSVIKINGVDKPDILLKFEKEEGILSFGDDTSLNIVVLLKKE